MSTPASFRGSVLEVDGITSLSGYTYEDGVGFTHWGVGHRNYLFELKRDSCTDYDRHPSESNEPEPEDCICEGGEVSMFFSEVPWLNDQYTDGEEGWYGPTIEHPVLWVKPPPPGMEHHPGLSNLLEAKKHAEFQGVNLSQDYWEIF